jgi:hypothetical protein
MIALQVAAGIVLAYIIIVNQRTLLKAGKLIGTVLFVGSLAAISVYFASLAFEALSASIGPKASSVISLALEWLGKMIFAIVMLSCAGIGGHCLSMVRYKLRGIRPPAVARENSVVLWSILNAVITASIFGLLSFTPLGRVYDGIDHWSRSSGYKDAGSVIVFLIALPWPAIWLLFLAQREARIKNDEASTTTTDSEPI